MRRLSCIGPFYAWVTGWEVTDPYGAVLYYDNGDTLDLVGFNGGTAYIRANIGYERYYWEEPTSSCQDEGMDTGYVDAQATVPKVDIKLNGNTVTGQTVNVAVGQEINLTTSPQPSNGTVTNSQWTVPGGNSDRIANYVVTFTDSQTYSISESFTMYLMFVPTGTAGTPIYVPLRKVSWSWSGGAFRVGSFNDWTRNSRSNTTSPDADVTDCPRWTANVTSLEFH